MDNDRTEVELHSTEASAVDAVRATLAMPPLRAQLVEGGGRFYIVGTAFAAWAAERQGYVKRIVPPTTAAPQAAPGPKEG